MIIFVGVVASASAASAQDSTICEDFAYQEQAQQAWDSGEGRPRPGYLSGMDEDGDGIACEHLPSEPVFGQVLWSSVAIVVIAILGGIGYWWTRRVKPTETQREEVRLFPGRTATEEVEDELALLKADQAIDDAENVNETQEHPPR